MYSYDEMIAAIRSGEIQPGEEIERSYDDDDLYWEFDYKSVISFAVGIDTPAHMRWNLIGECISVSKKATFCLPNSPPKVMAVITLVL